MMEEKMRSLTLLIILLHFLVFSTSAATAQTWWTYEELGNAAPCKGIETENGYVHTGGTFNVPGGGCYLAKTNKVTGALDWYQYYPSLFFEQSWGYDLVQTPDGGFAILSTDDMGFGNVFRLIRTNPMGESLWNKLIAPQNQAVAAPYYLVLFSPDSGFIMGGRNDGGIIMARTNKYGETLWTRRGVARESIYRSMEVRGIITKTNTIIYLLGLATVDLPTGQSIWRSFLATINAAGQVINKREYVDEWQRMVHLYGQTFFQLDNSGFLIAGIRGVASSSANPVESIFVFLLKTDSLKNELWRKMYFLPSIHSDFYRCGVEKVWQNENTINIAVCFYNSSLFPKGGIITTDLEGNFLNCITYSHPIYTYVSLRDAMKTSDGHAVLAGRSPPAGPPAYVTLLKTPLSGISENSFFSSQFSTLKVFPNPSTGLVNFHLPTGYNSSKVKIYDATGRIVKTFEFQNQFRVKLSPGIYLCETAAETDAKFKIIILGQ
ncbi:MAG: T9SS type A sorting domain-containing protein [Patescibacteria group bacterium]|nr:T9SS type A sorting domain-containing protein [Patescibacteria group bacterium]